MNILHKLHTDTVCPKRHSRPGYGSPGEITHNRTAPSNRRPINRRHTNQRKSPMPDYPTPATPTSISLEVFLPFTHIGRVSFIYTGGASSSHRTPPNIGWPVQTGRTIHLDNKLHGYPSPDILINPSTDRIHHYLYTIVHICGTNKEQFTFRQFLITHFKNSTALVKRPRQTDELPTCHLETIFWCINPHLCG